MKPRVLVDGRIFSLQKKGGVSQLWAYVISSKSWLSRFETTLVLYPGWENNMYLERVGSELMDYIEKLESPIPSNDNDNFYGDTFDKQRADFINGSLKFPPSIVVNTYYGRNVMPGIDEYLVTALDFAHEDHPALRSKPTTARMLELKRAAFSDATHISFISNSSRRRFRCIYPSLSEIDTSVIYLGHDPLPSSIVKSSNTVLHIGARGGYKNFETLALAMDSLMAHKKELIFLIFGGEDEDSTIENLRMKYPGRILFESEPNELEMDEAMSAATVFVSASEYEGFGIPLLNALSRRTVPVVSDIPVYREVAGNNAIFFPARDVDQLASCIEQALQSEAPRQSYQRSWDQVAEEYGRLVEWMLR